MAQRELLTVRIDPMVRDVIKAQASSLEGSDGYIVEMMAAETFKNSLPPGYRPGRRLPKEDDNE